ncbi:SDR family NAD(P)-dependent oxidoreductase [Streptomyces acidicola]|uniref:SDR family NAD(P)-dependent oxidoreductase n=1 Tax=Streptomyces acidicola TaxID=2596892 RepID=UPI0037F1B52E
MPARNAAKLDALAAELTAEGIEAAGFTGDISKPDTITEAFAVIKERYGTIDVLEFSPVDQTLGSVEVLDVGPENLQPQLDFYLTGAIRTVKQVASNMIAAESGTILGGGHPRVNPDVVARSYVDLYESRTEAELHYVALDT